MTNILRIIAISLILTSLWFSTSWAVSNSYESSAEYLYEFSEIQYFFSVFFAVAFFICTYLKTNLKQGLLLLFFVLWFATGRYVYLKEFSTCSIGTSIYFYQDNRFDLCGKLGDDYEKEIANIHYEKLPFWRIRFIHNSDKRTIFVGPFAWKSTIQILYKSGMTGF